MFIIIVVIITMFNETRNQGFARQFDERMMCIPYCERINILFYCERNFIYYQNGSIIENQKKERKRKNREIQMRN